MDAFRQIGMKEGIRGYYRGVIPSVQRAAVINGAGIASYDHAKRVATTISGREEGILSHILGSLISGFVSACVSSPFDVIKTRSVLQHTLPYHISANIAC